MRAAVSQVLKQFCKQTTLHGFKHLNSSFYLDRMGWIACCCVSLCCAGVLCAVVWARFLQLPTLLALVMNREATVIATRAPIVGVCLTPQRNAQLITQWLSLNKKESTLVSIFFDHLFHAQPVSEDELLFFEHLMAVKNLTLNDTLYKITPSCENLITRCRWQNEMIPCAQLFVKQVTLWGACCLAAAEKFNKILPKNPLLANDRLDLLLHCSDDESIPGCKFFTKYPTEEFEAYNTLMTGYTYNAQLTVVSVQDTQAMESVVDSTTCDANPSESVRLCQIHCKERHCGCLDPLRQIRPEEIALPLCSIRKMNCLRHLKKIDKSCTCPQSCETVNSDIKWGQSYMNGISSCFDPMCKDVDVKVSTMISLSIMDHGSKVFEFKYTETWWSLLSSLGGIFNMFLGVGLFSVLEFLFLIIWKLPVSIRRSSEFESYATHKTVNFK